MIYLKSSKKFFFSILRYFLSLFLFMCVLFQVSMNIQETLGWKLPINYPYLSYRPAFHERLASHETDSYHPSIIDFNLPMKQTNSSLILMTFISAFTLLILLGPICFLSIHICKVSQKKYHLHGASRDGSQQFQCCYYYYSAPFMIHNHLLGVKHLVTNTDHGCSVNSSKVQ